MGGRHKAQCRPRGKEGVRDCGHMAGPLAVLKAAGYNNNKRPVGKTVYLLPMPTRWVACKPGLRLVIRVVLIRCVGTSVWSSLAYERTRGGGGQGGEGGRDGLAWLPAWRHWSSGASSPPAARCIAAMPTSTP